MRFIRFHSTRLCTAPRKATVMLSVSTWPPPHNTTNSRRRGRRLPPRGWGSSQQAGALVLFLDACFCIVGVSRASADDGPHFVADEECEEEEEEYGHAQHDDAEVVLVGVVQLCAAFVSGVTQDEVHQRVGQHSHTESHDKDGHGELADDEPEENGCEGGDRTGKQ